MQVFDCTQPTYFDCDQTLVLFGPIPDTGTTYKTVQISYDGLPPETVHVNEDNVKALKQFAVRGYTIIVWSQGGHRWAEAVVKALNLEEYVDLILEKPKWYFDDLPAKAFMGEPVWKGDKGWLST